MGIFLGIDIGGSSTKIVGLREDSSRLGFLRVNASDPLTALYGALGSFMSAHSLALGDLTRIALTGVGASYVTGDIYGVPTVHLSEFTSIGIGGLALSGQDRAVVVSMGTGTAIIWAERDGEVRHVCGSGIGGGTLKGLCSLLVGTDSFLRICELSDGGDLHNIDLSIADVSRGKVGTLPPDATAANFAGLSDSASPEDLALGTVNLVLQAIGSMCVLACENCHSRTVVLTGSLSALPKAREIYDLFTKIYGIEFILPQDNAFATALGAAMQLLRT